MGTLEHLGGAEASGLFWPSLLVGLIVAVLCSPLSVLVVLKRMAFVGQGISHAAFGGIGLTTLLASLGWAAATGGARLPIILAFCIAAGAIVSWLSERGSAGVDTAIGVVLVGSMTLGALLLDIAQRRTGQMGVEWESILFGAIEAVTWNDIWPALGAAAIVLGSLWVLRRPMLFWAFDERASVAFGVPGPAMRLVLMVLLSLTIVVAMKLAGVVLATALLVLPGATALRLSDRLRSVLLLSGAAAVVGVLAGLVISFQSDLPTGAAIVAVLVGLYALSLLAGRAWQQNEADR